jgi:hypothetical protein
MSDIAMFLGIKPPPVSPTKKGRTYTMDGSTPRNKNARVDRTEAIKERRAAILALCSHEPTTMTEMADALEYKIGTLSEDLRKMCEEKILRYRLHRSENLYWVAA